MIFFFLCFQSLLLFPPFGATTAAAHANQGVCKLLEPATETNGKPCNAHVSTPGGKGKDPNPTGHPPPKGEKHGNVRNWGYSIARRTARGKPRMSWKRAGMTFSY